MGHQELLTLQLINICPSGPISVGHTATDQYQDLLKYIDLTEFFSVTFKCFVM